MVFSPESESWIKIIPLPGATITEVAEKSAEVTAWNSKLEFAATVRYKGICFTANGVTIFRSYEEFKKTESNKEFSSDIISEFNKKKGVTPIES